MKIREKHNFNGEQFTRRVFSGLENTVNRTNNYDNTDYARDTCTKYDLSNAIISSDKHEYPYQLRCTSVEGSDR